MDEIFRAAKEGDAGAVSQLLDADPALLETEGKYGDRPLAVAAKHGHLGVVKVLAERGADVDAGGDYWTALHFAAKGGHEEIVSFLLTNGAQANIGSDANEMTPLMVACRYDRLGVVRVLVQHIGTQGLEARAGNGMTALAWAVSWGCKEIVAFLLEEGADAGSRDDEGKTPMFHAAFFQVELVKMLLQHRGGEGLEDRDDRGKTALRWAAEDGDAETVAFLLSQGAEANTRDRRGRTPLMDECVHSHTGVVQLLLQHMGGRGLDDTDNKGNTALHWAVTSNEREALRLLLLAGADPRITNRAGQTPCAWAQCTTMWEDGRQWRPDMVPVFMVSEGPVFLGEGLAPSWAGVIKRCGGH